MRRIFAVAAMIISSQSFGQHAPAVPQDTTKTLDEVTLTASKYSVKTTETGKVVTIITRQDIEHAGSRDLAQVITEMGGVFVNGYNSNPGKEKNIYLRGARVEHTLITIDGVPVYDASGIGSNFDIRNISIDNVERIEILKGSQGTLYGTDAIAGVINIITKKGGSPTGSPSVNGVVSYGSYNTFRIGASVNGGYKNFDYNIGFSHLNTDGISEAKENDSVKFEKDAYFQNALSANFGFRINNRIRIQPFVRYTRFEGDLDYDAFADEKDFTNENNNFQTGVRNIFTVGKGNLNLLYQFTQTKRNYIDDSLSTNDNNSFVFNKDRYRSDEHFAEAFLVYPLKAVKLTAGIDLRSSNTDHYFQQKTIFSPLMFEKYQDGDSVNHSQVGAYAALNYKWKDLNIEGGGRLNHHSEYGNNFAFNFNPSYLLKNKLKLYVNISSGYKTPGLYQLFSFYGNPELQPEISLNLEGGLQIFSPDGKRSLRATYFNREVKDVIIFYFDTSTFSSVYINQDQQNDHGIEAEGSITIANQLQLKAIYNFVTGEVTTKKGNSDTSYFNLLRRPEHSFNFFAGWQAKKNLYVSAQLNFVGERNDVYFPPPTYFETKILSKAYTLLNVYAEYSLGRHLKLFADARNILNEDYMDIYGYSTMGMNAYGGLRFRF